MLAANNKINFLKQLIFWIILGVISTSLAEVLAGSMPFPIFNPTGWLITIPIYTLHILVLGGLAVLSQPNFYRLYLFGIIFGLYEAFITKVLWQPPWEPVIEFFDVAVVETLVLILFWHPILSFILPLIIFDQFVSRTPSLLNLLPINLQTILLNHKIKLGLFFATLFGITHSFGLSFTHSILASCSLVLTLSVLMWLARKLNHQQYSLAQILPTKQQLWILGVTLIMVYIVAGINFQSELLPNWRGHLVVASLYLIAILFIWRESKQAWLIPNTIPIVYTRKQLLLVVLVFLVVSLIAPFLGANLVTIISTVVLWSIAVIIGILLLYGTINHVVWTK